MAGRKVAYLYEPDSGSFFFGDKHPMKPQRLRMTHSLLMAYDLYRKLDVYRPYAASALDLQAFHSEEYISFLATVFPGCQEDKSQCRKHNVGHDLDCPIFEGCFEFQSMCAGASVDSAALLNDNDASIAINWAGGLHHAKRSAAAGFCYVNDIVLGIIELLKVHARVLYIDIDVHHGDGVEEAFLNTSRVMTVSFHKYDGDFFPATGSLADRGVGDGYGYSLNVPLSDGLSDESFERIFQPIIDKCIQVYRPGAIVLQCGADSLAGDVIGTFNLSSQGHAKAVSFCASYNIPLMLLGGGGYTIKNVARCWSYETAVALRCDEDIPDEIPANPFSEYFITNRSSHVTPCPKTKDRHDRQLLDAIVMRAMKELSTIEHAPSVPFVHVPPKRVINHNTDVEEENTQIDRNNEALDFEDLCYGGWGAKKIRKRDHYLDWN